MEIPYSNSHYDKILEIGSGSGQHFKHVRSSFYEYYETDLRLDFLKKAPSAANKIQEMQDVNKLTYPDNYFDRIIVSCVLPHVDRPSNAISELRRVIKPNGELVIYVPCEPGIFLRFVRRIVTIRKHKKIGSLNPYELHYNEHIHYYLSINHYIRHCFDKDYIKTIRLPFLVPFWNLNLFSLYFIKVFK